MVMGDITFAVCVWSVLDAFPPKLLIRFVWNCAQGWRSVPPDTDTVSHSLVAIAQGVPQQGAWFF